MWGEKKLAKLFKVIRKFGRNAKECRVVVTNRHVEIKFHHTDGQELNWVYENQDPFQTFGSFIRNIKQDLITRYGET